MNVTKQEAQDSLNEIDDIIARTRRAIAQGPSSKMLILWGIIWVLGYGSTQFFPQWQGRQWLPLVAVGMVTSMVVGMRQRATVHNSHGARIGAFWFILFGYAVIWINLLHSTGPVVTDQWTRQTGAYFATVPMFAYVVGGLWLGRFFVWLGGIVTALTLVGFFFLPQWFNVWMAFTGGGSLIVAGLFINKFWR